MIFAANIPKTILSFLFAIVFFAFSYTASSQNTDSLVLLLEKSEANSVEKAELLTKVSEFYTSTSPEQYLLTQLL